MEFLRDLFILLGRVFISAVFLVGAYERIKHWKTAESFMKSKGVPQVNLVLPAAMVLKILGALLVLFGWHAHIGALLLLIVTIPFTYWMHAFWNVPAGEKEKERALFMKEVGIIGGLLLILAMGAGAWGVSGS